MITEQITNEQVSVLEGEHNNPVQKERLFSNLTALADYIKVFSIQSGAFGKANVNGQECFVLQYSKREE